MSQHTKRNSGVEIVRLMNNIDVARSAVCVLKSPGYLIRLLRNLIRVQYRSSFWGRQYTTIFPYVTYLRLFSGIMLCVRKKCFYDLHPAADFLVYLAYLIGKVFDSNWSVIWNFNYIYVLHGNSNVFISDFIGNFGNIVMLCHQLSVSC